MTQFLAKVGTLTGEIEELSLTADSESVLRRRAQRQGLPRLLGPRRASASPRSIRNPFSSRQRITQTEFTLFNQELAALSASRACRSSSRSTSCSSG